MFQQQGDVLMFPVAAIPAGAKKAPHKTLADGEATGHRHQAIGAGAAILDLGDRRFLSAPKGCRVTHQEHKEQRLAPGLYEVKRVVEYDPFADEIRNVVD